MPAVAFGSMVTQNTERGKQQIQVYNEDPKTAPYALISEGTECE